MAAVWKIPTGPGIGKACPVLFLDRDGVLIRDRDYLKDPALIEILPGIPDALNLARKAGYQLIGLSNQSGIGRGYFSEKDFGRVMERLDEMLAAAGAPLDGFYYCPHDPSAGCACRKPAPGMLDEVSGSLSWDPARSWMIGDKVSDVELALGRGLSAFLVLTGYGRQEEALVRQCYGNDHRVHIALDLPAAISSILEMESGKDRP